MAEVPGWPRSPEHAPRVLGVAELNRLARLSLEDGFPDLWVEGELADVARPPSGHVYFTLQEGQPPAQVRGVMYRNDAQRARARLENGARVRLRGSLTIYEPRGSFQLLARVALPAGQGDRKAELERLRKKLAAEGLFGADRKRPLPRVPRVVGVVTSRAGAAIHDVVRVVHGRLGVRIVLAHCLVQGPEAPASIVRALRAIQEVPGLDVVIVTRGGGASEDLSAYDDERVARAAAACRVPLVSGVGHEVDVTLVDLVADARAATPSNAAEMAVPDGSALRAELEALDRGLARALDQRVQRERLRLERAERRLLDPRRTVGRRRQALAALQGALEQRAARTRAEARRTLERLRARLAAEEPRARLGRDRARLERLAQSVRSSAGIGARRSRLGELEAALVRAGASLGRGPRSELELLAGRLEALSPLGILARGYAVVLHRGRALGRASDAAPGDPLVLRLHEGTLAAVVVEPPAPRKPPV